MSEINPQQLLSQIRAMQADLHGPANVGDRSGDGFATMLASAINKVNETQQTASTMKQAFDSGDRSATLAEVMIASQKADLSFRAMTEVRNKLVAAYQEIMNMPV